MGDKRNSYLAPSSLLEVLTCSGSISGSFMLALPDLRPTVKGVHLSIQGLASMHSHMTNVLEPSFILQKAEKFLAGLKQDADGQAAARDISTALEAESIIKHKDEVSPARPGKSLGLHEIG